MDLREVKERGKRVINRHPWELARMDIVLDYFNRLKLPSGGGLLDLGCGDPWFAEQFSAAKPGLSIIAVDIAFEEQQMKEYAEKLSGRKIQLFRSLEDAERAVQTPVDVVLLLDVIEHVEDDISFLKRLHTSSLITDQTHVIITVPAYQSLFCSHDTFLGHYRRYTNESLKAHIAEAGYFPVTCTYFFFSLLFPRCIRVVLENTGLSKKKTTGLVSWNGSEGLTGFFRSILWMDYKITQFFFMLGLKFPGLSNIVVCKRVA